MFRNPSQFWSPELNAGDPPTPAVPPPAPPTDPPAAAALPVDPPAAPTPDAPPADPPAPPPVDPPASAAVPPVDYSALSVPPDSGLEASDLAAIATVAKAKGWALDTAQDFATAFAESVVSARASLKAELDAHPQLSGANAAAHEESFLRAVDRWIPATTPEGARLRADFVKTGFWNHPGFRLAMGSIGRAAGEDPGLGSGAAPARSTVRLPDYAVMFDPPKK